MDRETLDKLKIAVTNKITTLLDYLGVRYADYGTHLKAVCPAKEHGGDRNNQSAFCWWYDSRSWICFSHHCHVDFGSDVIGLVRAIKLFSFNESIKWLEDFTKNELEISPESISDISVVNTKRDYHNKRVHEGRLKFLNNDENSLSILLKRGFSLEILHKFDIGFWSRLGSYMHDRIIIPIRDYDGNIVGFTGRTIWPESEWYKHGVNEKWKHGSDYVQYIKGSFHKSIVVFNLHNAKNYLGQEKKLIVVEAPLDGIKLSMAGINNWIATLGVSISSQQRILIIRSGVTSLYLAFDGDNAGREAMTKVGKQLEKYFHINFIKLPNGIDPADMSIGKLEELFCDAKNTQCVEKNICNSDINQECKL